MSFSEKHLKAFQEDGWLEYRLEARVCHPYALREAKLDIESVMANCTSVAPEPHVYIADPEDPDSTLIKGEFLLKAREVSASQKLSLEITDLDGVVQAFIMPEA